MKKYFIGSLLGISTLTLVAFKVVNYTPKAATAEVNKIRGLYIFSDSNPVMPYDSIGTLSIGFVTGTQYESVRENLIKRTKNKYPNANGIIMIFDKKGIDKCIAIKLK